MTKTTVNPGPVGGAASTAGAAFGAAIAAWAAVKMLQGKRTSFPWNLPQDVFIHTMACESDSPVDDLRLDLTPDGQVFLQMKHGLQIGSEFNKAVRQMVRQYAEPTFDMRKSRLVIVTDQSASGTVRTDVVQALSWFHGLPESTSLADFPHGAKQRAALQRIENVFSEEWEILKRTRTDTNWREFLGCMYLTVLDPMDGAESSSCIDSLRPYLNSGNGAPAWEAINAVCLESGRFRRPMNAATLEADLSRRGIHFRVEAGGQLATVSALAHALNQRHIGLLKERQQYVRSYYVPRAHLDRKLEAVRADGVKRPLLISGASGQGKTTWCAAQCDLEAPNHIAGSLLVSAEVIAADDRDLQDTLHRLLLQVAGDQHVNDVAPAEIRRWLHTAELQVFVDGLDRSGLKRDVLLLWIRATVRLLKAGSCQLILTTRPELLSPIKNEFGGELTEVGLGDFLELEAIEAADRRDSPHLAKFRHPRLMSFHARLGSRTPSRDFRRAAVVAAFIELIASDTAARHDLPPEQVRDVLNQFGERISRSPDGFVHSAAPGNKPEWMNKAEWAVRKDNILTIHQGRGRFEIDEVAEHLAGQFIDIDSHLEQWSEIKSIALKVGALRSAFEQLAVKDTAAALPLLQRLVADQLQDGDSTRMTLLCSVVSAHEDILPLYSMASQLVSSWTEHNFYAGWGTGLSVLDLASDFRWPQKCRLELMWLMARNESGYDWRAKHWLTPLYAPNFRVTEWRRRFIPMVAEGGHSALTFLSNHFLSNSPLQDTEEADLGLLAQGCFVLAAEGDVATAVRTTLEMEKGPCERVARFIAQRHPSKTLAFLVSEHMLSLQTSVSLIHSIWNHHPHEPGLVDIARQVMEQPDCGLADREILLCILASHGDHGAAMNLVKLPNLGSQHLNALYGLKVTEFRQALEYLLRRVDANTVDYIKLGFYDIPPTFVETMADVMITVWADQPPPTAGYVVESMVYAIQDSQASAGRLVETIEMVLKMPKAWSRKPLIICAGRSVQGMTEQGLVLREHLLQRIKRWEDDGDNLSLLVGDLVQNAQGDLDTRTYLQEMLTQHPGLWPRVNCIAFTPAAQKLRSELTAIFGD